jgi:hypothetical protein
MRTSTNRFTIFDALEASGYFDSNPANQQSRDKTTGESLYKGPVQYPKMFYHPEAAERITVPAEIIMTPIGPKSVGEQREIISAIAEDAVAEEKLRAEGWHDHPAKALMAAGRDAPPMSSQAHIDDLQAEVERLQKQLADANALRATQVAATGSKAKAASATTSLAN